ncbi:MAG TPA: hypothetical protein VFB12_01915 [Ktedonobacteraceae bacterium]|nr:hypothetical protein [Ktedonobacteraceae bacterium]
MQKWEYCLVLAHLEGGYIEKTVVREEAQTTPSWPQLRSVTPESTSTVRDLGLSRPEVPVPQFRVLAINGKRPKEESLSMYALTSELGEQGWALVNVEHTILRGNQIVSVWVFQRPKPLNRM